MANREPNAEWLLISGNEEVLPEQIKQRWEEVINVLQSAHRSGYDFVSHQYICNWVYGEQTNGSVHNILIHLEMLGEIQSYKFRQNGAVGRPSKFYRVAEKILLENGATVDMPPPHFIEDSRMLTD